MIVYCVLSLAFLLSGGGGFLVDGDGSEEVLDLQRQIQSILTQQINLQNQLQEANQRVNTLQKQIETLQSKDENIAFFAYLSKDLTNPPAGTTVKFDEVETNLGHAYDPAHGVFAAPLNGSYHFQFIGAAPENRQAGHMMHLYIMRNGKRESYAFLDRNTDHWLQSSAVSVLHLARGDRIWVEITEAVGSHVLAGHRTADNATHTHFSGFLIHAD